MSARQTNTVRASHSLGGVLVLGMNGTHTRIDEQFDRWSQEWSRSTNDLTKYPVILIGRGELRSCGRIVRGRKFAMFASHVSWPV